MAQRIRPKIYFTVCILKEKRSLSLFIFVVNVRSYSLLAWSIFRHHCTPHSAGSVVALCKLTAEVEIQRADFSGLIFTRISQRRTAFTGTPLKEHRTAIESINVAVFSLVQTLPQDNCLLPPSLFSFSCQIHAVLLKKRIGYDNRGALIFFRKVDLLYQYFLKADNRFSSS